MKLPFLFRQSPHTPYKTVREPSTFKAVLVVNVGGKLAQKFAFGVYELAAFGAFEVVVLAAFGVFAGVLIARAVAVAAREFSYLARGAQFFQDGGRSLFYRRLSAFSELSKISSAVR